MSVGHLRLRDGSMVEVDYFESYIHVPTAHRYVLAHLTGGHEDELYLSENVMAYPTPDNRYSHDDAGRWLDGCEQKLPVPDWEKMLFAKAARLPTD